MSTISNVTYSTYVLGNASQNPLTVTSTGAILVNSPTQFTNAITGNSGVSWTVSNLGTVESVGNYGVGISLGSGGQITNGTSGLIHGSAVGVQINGVAGNTADIVNYGVISETSPNPIGNAIAFNGVAGTVTNKGTVVGYNPGTGAANAIQLGSGGTVVNTGLVEGFSFGNNQDGVAAFAGFTMLNNTGTIEAPGSNGNGVNITAGNIVNGGLITGAGQAISMTSGYISNSGVVAQTGAGGSEAVNLGAGAGSGTLVNTGTVSSIATSGDAVLVGNAGGTIINGATGLISAYHTDIGFFPGQLASLNIANYGGIQSTQTGAGPGSTYAINTNGASTAFINNFGRITSGQNSGGGAILLSTGQIINHAGALISAPGGTGINSQGAVTVTNLGTIIGTGANGFGAVLAAGSTLTNGGTIAGQVSAVTLNGGNSRLIVDPGGAFSGNVFGNGAALELASAGGATGVLQGFGATISNFASLQFDGAAKWTVEGTAGGFPGTISGFEIGDTIILDGFVAVSESFASNALVLTNATNNQVTLNIQGNFATADFTISGANGGTGTAIVDAVDITPPTLVDDSALNVVAGKTATITPTLLRFDDDGSSHAQETYTVVNPPADGTLLKSGVATSSFTQADIDNGLISYQETDRDEASDSFTFTVSDAAGNTTAAQQFNVAIAPAPYFTALQLSGSGQVDFLTFTGTTLTGSNLMTAGLWNIVANGDYNGDGQTDLVTQGPTDQIDLVFLNSNMAVMGSALNSTPFWAAHGAGNFGTVPGVTGPAVITQSPTSGQIDLLWFNSGGGLAGSDLLNGSYWNVVGAGDFTGDGNDEIVTQSSNTGQIDLLTFTGANLTASLLLNGSYDPVKAVDDFNHDGIADLTTQNPTTGFVDHLIFTGATLTGSLAAATAFPGNPVVDATSFLNLGG